MDMNELSLNERNRYHRQIHLAGFGLEAQLALKAATVLVVGAGGLGSPVLRYLAAAGVGRLRVVDPDRVSLSNLQRQILFDEADVGRLKTEVAKEKLLALNSEIAVESFPQSLDAACAFELLDSVDLVVDACDNFPTRYLLSDACVIKKIPLVYGAIQGFTGQVSVFCYQDGPSYRCLFPEPPPEGTVLPCGVMGVVGILPGQIGCLQAGEAIKLLTGLGEPLSGRLLLWDALTAKTQLIRLQANPANLHLDELPQEHFIASACGLPDSHAAVLEITPKAYQAMRDEDHLLIDVREDWEWAICRLNPSLQWPIADLLASRQQPVAFDATRKVILLCHHGVRSLQAATALASRYPEGHFLSLQGGVEAWFHDVDPDFPRYEG
jgi:sulfur-carrier protein adenylyltransferase/sulfurtransferase